MRFSVTSDSGLELRKWVGAIGTCVGTATSKATSEGESETPKHGSHSHAEGESNCAAAAPPHALSVSHASAAC
eukprot:6208490-Pleurochrysis_carterae.AAC.2